MQKTFIIPGLAMRAAEIPKINNVFVLENPEIGDGINLHVPYAIEELAAIHVKSILRHLHNTDDTHLFVGMSMGGMILSVIAAIYRSTLPPASRFTYVATSANTRELPAISDQELANYYLCKPGSTTDFRRLLEPAFSPDFKERYPERVTDYINYRATGKNCQTPAAFVRQVNALRNYSGTQYFSKVDPKETLFIRGSDDLLLDSAHGTILKQIVNEANHVEIKNLGHMVNIERPEALYECKTP